MKRNNAQIKLSPSGMEMLNRCPRCFWLKYKRGISQPEGIVSRLANRFDGVLKSYFDIYRASGKIPPLVEGKIEGKLEDPLQVRYLYNYDDPSTKLGTGKYSFEGRLDECLITSDGKYVPIDFKTSSSDPREKEEILPAYQTQLDSYSFLMEKSDKKTAGIGYLVFIYPAIGRVLHKGFPMIIHIVRIKTNPKDAEVKFFKAIEVLERAMPDSSPDCPFCQWRERVNNELGP